MNNKKVLIITISLMLIASIVSVIGLTYALWIQNDTQEKESIVETGCFTTTFEDANAISLPNTYPMIDSKGMALTPYTFTIKNTCTIASNYVVNFERLSGTTLEEGFTKVVINSTTPKVLTSYPGATTTIAGALSSRTLTSGKLEAGASIKYNLRVWIDENATNNDVTGDTLSAKVVVAHGATDITNAASYITSLAATDTTNFATDDPDHNVRYIGSDPNNYVNFNGEKWRIIGVFDVQESESSLPEKRLKIIRDEPIGDYAWDVINETGTTINRNRGINQWGPSVDTNGNAYPGADIMQTLNTTYLTGGTGTCYDINNSGTKECIFDDDHIKPLSAEAQSLISDAVWNTGSFSVDPDFDSITLKDYYEAERSNNTGRICYNQAGCNDNIIRTTKWTGKVGLMYPSDFGYATDGDGKYARDICLSEIHYYWVYWGSYEPSECLTGSWFYNDSIYPWTITPVSYDNLSSDVFYFEDIGWLTTSNATFDGTVIPVVYLDADVKITGTGNGSSATPYDLTI